MKYIRYFEGFKLKQIKDLISNRDTSIIKIDRSFNNNLNKLSSSIKNYDISNFTHIFKHGQFSIYPDDGFIEIYKKYCESNNFEVKNLAFSITILPCNIFTNNIYNQIDSEDILPDNNLKGLSLGYKLYKYVLNIVDFIMTDKDNLPEAKNLWYNLLQDDNVYSGTNKNFNLIINRNIDNEKLKDILNRISKFNLIYDDDLNLKIKELYGSN